MPRFTRLSATSRRIGIYGASATARASGASPVGPACCCRPWASASTPVPAIVVARPLTPTVFKKSRRLTSVACSVFWASARSSPVVRSSSCGAICDLLLERNPERELPGPRNAGRRGRLSEQRVGVNRIPIEPGEVVQVEHLGHPGELHRADADVLRDAQIERVPGIREERVSREYRSEERRV